MKEEATRLSTACLYGLALLRDTPKLKIFCRDKKLSVLLLCIAQTIKKLKVAHGLCYCMADILLPTEFKDSLSV
jgi:hypothetical protein